MTAAELQQAFKTLSDPTRVRILSLLAREELAVQELVEVLGLAQSRVSGHLKILRDAGWVHDRRQGTFHFYRACDPADPAARRCWEFLRERLEADPTAGKDLRRLDEVVRERAARTRAFFDSVAPEWDDLRGIFNDDALRANAIARLVPDGLKVLEVGTGTGALALDLVELGLQVTAVDHSQPMLEALEETRRRRRVPRLRLERADAENLPLQDGEVDAALAHMVLRYLARPAQAIREMARVTRAGGTVVLIDFVRHDHDWMRKELGVQWLGFAEEEVRNWFRAADLETPRFSVYPTESRGRELPATFVAHARRLDPETVR